MNLLFRYILTRYLTHLGAVTLLMTGLYLAVDTPERLAHQGSLLARLPLVLSHVLPVAGGAALLSTFHRLRASGVLTTLRSSGIGWPRLLAPALAGGLLVVVAEAAMSLAASPAALAAATPRSPGERPTWFLDGGQVLHVGEDGALVVWPPGSPPGPHDQDLEGPLAKRLDLLASRPSAAQISTMKLPGIARAAQSTGHDPRPERVELWTRLLLPAAALGLLLSCMVAVRRERHAVRGVARLLGTLAVGWLGLSVATQLYVNGASPAWAILVLPASLLTLCVVSPWP